MSLRYEGYKTALIEHDCFISPHLYGEVSRNEYELDIIVYWILFLVRSQMSMDFILLRII